MLLHITHETLYDYAPGVDTAQHMAHLQPPDTPYQTCISHQLAVEPPCADLDTRLDAFGNHRSYWSMSSFHQQLRVRAHTALRTHSPQGDLLDAMAPTPESTMAWEDARSGVLRAIQTDGPLPHLPGDESSAELEAVLRAQAALGADIVARKPELADGVRAWRSAAALRDLDGAVIVKQRSQVIPQQGGQVIAIAQLQVFDTRDIFDPRELVLDTVELRSQCCGGHRRCGLGYAQARLLHRMRVVKRRHEHHIESAAGHTCRCIGREGRLERGTG
jgi:hypothetical protein